MLGLAFPVIVTGFAQLAFANKADGSLVKVDGKVVGSRLAAQAFTKPQYFHPRPSATAPAYNAGATTFANLGPTNPDLLKNVRTAAASILRLERPYNPGLTVHDIPVDAVTTSGSGIDPDISPANAALQSRASLPSAASRSPPCRSSSTRTRTAAASASSASPV